MNKQSDNVLGNVSFPSVEIDVVKPPEQFELDTVDYDLSKVSYDEIVETKSNQMLVEGVAELKDHPQLESFLRVLHHLKSDFALKVAELSKDFELRGSVKVLFTVSEKN